MMTVTTMQAGALRSRDVEIILVRVSPDEVLEVRRMFDAQSSETFDPTDAVEVEVESGGLLTLQSGDRITMRVDVQE